MDHRVAPDDDKIGCLEVSIPVSNAFATDKSAQFQTLIKNPKNSIRTSPLSPHIRLVLSDIGQASDRWLSGLRDGVSIGCSVTAFPKGLSFRVPDRLERWHDEDI